jgi:D-tyrosyl-tRNA(Tyr) deacylase
MRAVVQRVTSAAVTVVDGATEREVGRIGQGLVVFVGVAAADGETDAKYISAKISELRVFEDEASGAAKLNRSVKDVGGSVLIVSQFTVMGDCRKGRRPSFDGAAIPQLAKPLYDDVVRGLRAEGLTVATGEFRAAMRVAVVNDGPVTLLLDSRKVF